MHLSKNEHGYWEVRVKGRDRRWKTFSLHVKDLKQAKDMVSRSRIREIETAADIGILNAEVVSTLATGIRHMTINEAVPIWKRYLEDHHRAPNTVRRSTTDVYAWANSLEDPNMPLTAIRQEHIDRWVNKPCSRTLSTRVMIMNAIRPFFRFLQAKGWILGNPAELVEIDKDNLTHLQKELKPCVIFSDEEIETLLAATAPEGSRPSVFWHAAVALGRYTGLRISDVACLEWSCFFTPGKIQVWTRKRDRRVELPLEPELLARIVADLPQDDPVYVFPHQHEQAIDPWHRHVLPKLFGDLLAHCEIFGKSFHGLRATYVTRCAEAGTPMEHIMKSVGHTDEAMTKHYVRPWAYDKTPTRIGDRTLERD